MGLLGVGATMCRRDPALATRLLACSDAAGAELGAWDDEFEGGVRRDTLETARELLGDAAFAAAYREGQALALDDAVARVLAASTD
jgi:hypothetical protein